MIVLDANILIRAVLGERVERLLTTYSDWVQFIAPDTAFAEAREHLPAISAKLRLDRETIISDLESLREAVQSIDLKTYSTAERTARKRIESRDPDDWPVLATALVFDCPIWTEDYDFFGAGVATWTSDRVEIFLSMPTDG